MGDRTIEASYLWTEEEFVAASRHVARYATGPMLKIGIPFLIVACGFLGVIFVRAEGRFAFLGAPLLFTSAMFVYMFYLGGRDVGYRNAFRRAGALNQANEIAEFLIDDERVRFMTAGTDTSFIWSLIPVVIHVPDGFLIRCGGVYRWLPRHAFKNAADVDAFVTLASHRSAKFVDKT